MILALVLVMCFAAAGSLQAQGAKPSADKLIAVLKSNASLKDKHDACRHLAALGDKRAVGVLAGLLADEKLSHMARYALEPIADPSVDAALRKALGTLNGSLRVGVINSIGFRRDAEAVDALAKLLTGSDASTTAAAAGALGQIATPDAVAALGRFRKTAPKALRPVAADASLAAAERLVEQGKGKTAVAIYTELQASSWPAHVRLGAFSGLLTADADEGPRMIIRAITGKDAALRAVAISRITTLKGKNVAKRFAAELPKVSPETQVLLIGALVGIGDPVARPAVVAAAGSDDANVRAAALKALGALGDASCVPLLCRAATAGKTPVEVGAAAGSLWALRGDGIDVALIRAMQTAPPAGRPALIEILIVRNVTAAVGPLIAQAKTDDSRVRAAAFKALGKLATPKDLPALLGLLTSLTDEAARSAAERAVIAVAGQIPDDSARADAVLTSLKSAKTTPTKCSLLRTLSGIGNAKALAAVNAALADKDAKVADTAVRALAAWPDGRALETLMGVVRTTDNRIHRILALRGCVRLLGMGGRPADQTLKGYRELMAAARRDDDKKLVLAGLATVASPAAAAAVEPYLADANVGAEAELAMLGIARGLVSTSAKQAKAVAQKLIAVSKNASIKRQAAEIIRRGDRFGDYIVAWQVSGPYAKRGVIGEPVLNVVFPPESGGKNVAWKPLAINGPPAQPWMFALDASFGGVQRAVYVRTWIHSDRAKPARLEMGADDGIKAWVNAKLVHTNLVGGAAIPGEEKVNVSLKQGWNTLVLKIGQQTGPWAFCARLRAPDGGPLAGVYADATREATTAKLPTPPAPAAKVYTPAGDWTPLFNGKDLTGWKKTGTAIFTVEDGSLVGTQTDGKGGDLWTTSQYDNFELRVTYRVVWPSNSGFWFRHNGKKGYQYDVLKYKRPVAFSGSLYCPGKLFIIRNLKESLENRDGWNEARVRAAGDELTLWLNGTQTGTCRDTTLTKGTIGIQVHPGNGFKGMKMIVKKMDIRLLKPKAD